MFHLQSDANSLGLAGRKHRWCPILFGALVLTFSSQASAVHREATIKAIAGGAYPFVLSSFSAPSMNNNGWVAFQGVTQNSAAAAVENIFSVNPTTGQVIQLMNNAFEYPVTGSAPLQQIDRRVVVNDQNEVLAWRYLTARVQIGGFFGDILDMPLTYLETWPTSGVNSAMQLGVPQRQVVMGDAGMSVAPHLVFFVNPATAGVYPTSFNPVGFDAIYRGAAINNVGQVAFSALDGGQRLRITTPQSPPLPLFAGGGVSNEYVPSIADNGNVVFSLHGTTLYRETFNFSQLQQIAGATTGFTAIGTRPGISDDGHVIAFAGRHSTMGEGVFVSTLNTATNSFSSPTKVAGIADGRIDVNEHWYDPDGSLPMPAVEVGKLKSINLNSPLAVNRAGASEQNQYNLLFLANNLQDKPTLEGARIDRLTAIASKARTVMGFGDVVSGFPGTVSAISVEDPLSVNNQAALALQTTTAGGGQYNAVATLEGLFQQPGQGGSPGNALIPTTNYFGVGVNWSDLNGGQSAMNLRNQLKASLNSVFSDRVLSLSNSAANGQNLLSVTSEFAQYVNGLKKGDTLVIHCVSHGGTSVNGPEPAVLTRFGPPAGSPSGSPDVEMLASGDDFISLGGPPQYALTDDEFIQMLSNPKLVDVRKIVFLDSCRSGGFIPDIQAAGIGNISVLAASSEGGFSHIDLAQGNVFTNALVSAFYRENGGSMQADENADGEVTMVELHRFMGLLAQRDYRIFDGAGSPFSYSDLLGRDLFLADGETELIGHHAIFTGLQSVLYSSSDFRDGINDLFPLGIPLQPGDFDGDGDVDGADFVAWQTHFPTAGGATLADGDADGDGDVDGADFVVWQTNFPFTPSPGASPVPEPNSLATALLAAIWVGIGVRRRGSSRR